MVISCPSFFFIFFFLRIINQKLYCFIVCSIVENRSFRHYSMLQQKYVDNTLLFFDCKQWANFPRIPLNHLNITITNTSLNITTKAKHLSLQALLHDYIIKIKQTKQQSNIGFRLFLIFPCISFTCPPSIRIPVQESMSETIRSMHSSMMCDMPLKIQLFLSL